MIRSKSIVLLDVMGSNFSERSVAKWLVAKIQAKTLANAMMNIPTAKYTEASTFTMVGIRMVPMAATVTGPEPESRLDRMESLKPVKCSLVKDPDGREELAETSLLSTNRRKPCCLGFQARRSAEEGSRRGGPACRRIRGLAPRGPGRPIPRPGCRKDGNLPSDFWAHPFLGKAKNCGSPCKRVRPDA